MIKTAAPFVSSIVFAIGFAFASLIPAQARAAPIFPPLVSGEYSLAILAAPVEYDVDGVPTTPPTRSVGLRRIDLEGAPLLFCVDAGPGERVPVLVTVPASGSRAELRGAAFNSTGCEGFESEASTNGAFVFFVPPAPPGLDLGP